MTLECVAQDAAADNRGLEGDACFDVDFLEVD